MERADYYPWLELRRTRLVELICEETAQATRQTNRVEVELTSRVGQWVGRFLEYIRTGEIRIMIQQIEEANRRKIARGETLNTESAELQSTYILKALARLIAESEFSPAECEWFNQQMLRTMTTLNTNARMVYSRLILEQMNQASNRK